ncbi:MAG: ABC transporter permease [Aeromicrobium sp.]|uniref:ABC transporter permease n=1 Tax=Aeromicrobium sp. TaxID=1871063 RepID=UPI0025C60C90|nr:ABC transporter permease [Aeromicrobium sp.]MCK5892053.1 ABC transporter permease [Aeromicrobium sp.]MDF1704288.1 ABC transporter permease [Aeromicrobium sp.]
MSTETEPETGTSTAAPDRSGSSTGAGDARAARPLKALTLAMFKGFVRDRMTLFWAIAFPLMFLVLFGGIFTDQGQSRPADVIVVGDVSVIDDAPTQAREAIDRAIAITREDDLDAALAKVRDGDATAVVTEEGGEVTVRYSAADAVAGAQIQGVMQAIVQQANTAVYQQATGEPPAFTFTASQVEDESLQAIQYVTPSLLGWAVAMSATFGAAANLVMWRKSGLLRRLRLAPVRTSSVVLARVGVSLVIALVQAVIFIGLGVGAFGLQLSGWWPLVVPLLLAGTLAFLSIGMLAGAVSKTEEGAIGLANFIVLPMAFLSGSFFPLDGAPAWLRAVSNALPLKHLNQGMLDVMVREQGPSAIVLPIVILLGFAAVFATISARLFRWEA